MPGMCEKQCGRCGRCVGAHAQDVIDELTAERDHYKNALQDVVVGLQGPGSVSRVLKGVEEALKGPKEK